jgi:hypothetical protein
MKRFVATTVASQVRYEHFTFTIFKDIRYIGTYIGIRSAILLKVLVSKGKGILGNFKAVPLLSQISNMCGMRRLDYAISSRLVVASTRVLRGDRS